MNRGSDALRCISGVTDLQALRELRLFRLHECLYFIRDPDYVLSASFLHNKGNCFLTVLTRHRGPFLETVNDLRNISYIDRHVLFRFDHNVADLCRVVKLSRNPDQIVLLPDVNTTARYAKVLCADLIYDVVERDVVKLQPRCINVHLHLTLKPALHIC